MRTNSAGRTASALLLAAACAVVLVAGTLSEAADNPVAWTVSNVLARIPPLRHDATGRWPLITWEPFLSATNDRSFQRGEPLPPDVYRELLKRGLTQAIRMNEKYIPTASALQQAGSPVIVMEGNGGDGPYADTPEARHYLPTDYVIPKGEHLYPCPMQTAGWGKAADRVRATMQKFKTAGVTVDAVWLDWEVEPLWWTTERWRQAQNCSRCESTLPPGVLRTSSRYTDFIMLYRQKLLSDYLAAPILDVFPKASVSNWDSLPSTAERPAYNWWGNTFPPMDIGRFTASMPAVYGSNAIFTDYWYGFLGAPFRHWRHLRSIGEDEAYTDRVYTHVMLGSFSACAFNTIAQAPGKQIIPWVSRVVDDSHRKDTPVLTRERYREILRHVWLRGADAMQVFNPRNPDHPVFMLLEVEDAVAVYDEMLAYRPFLTRGVVMNTEPPSFQDTGALWSGLRCESNALVRAFTQGSDTVRFSLRPWADGPKLALDATPAGTTYLLERAAGTIRAMSQ